MRILFCGNTFPDAPEFLRQRLPLDTQDELIVCREPDIRSMLDGVDVVIPKMHRIGRPELEAGTFKLVQQWGAGVEGIDLEAAHEHGVHVANVPATGGNAESVAEHALLLILSLLRDLPKAQAHVRAGIHGAPLGKMLAGRAVCLYGLGAIALPLAKRLQNLRVRLIGITRDPSSPKTHEFRLDHCFAVRDRDTAFAETDILVLCMRYTEDMRGSGFDPAKRCSETSSRKAPLRLITGKFCDNRSSPQMQGIEDCRCVSHSVLAETVVSRRDEGQSRPAPGSPT
jgi:phosphoglycerate dehydrogenase-like enzyme